MLERWLRRVVPCRPIWACARADGLLVERFYLLETRWFAVYLHRLCRSDEQRALHDHPWAFVTCLLSGGYYEHTPRGRQWHRRFSVLYRPANWLHRLELVRPVWTLVIRGRRRREWGFLTRDGWQHWHDYHVQWCDDEPRSWPPLPRPVPPPPAPPRPRRVM
jgi:hypothetical protein